PFPPANSRVFRVRVDRRGRILAVPGAAPGVFRGRTGAADIPRQPRHEPVPVDRWWRCPAPQDRGVAADGAAGAANHLLRNRGWPEPVARPGVRGRLTPYGGIPHADVVGQGAGPGFAGVLPEPRLLANAVGRSLHEAPAGTRGRGRPPVV